MTFWETIERGEYVMISLAVIFILIVVIWSVCGGTLLRERSRYPRLMQRLRDHLGEGDLENARQISQTYPSPGASSLTAGLNKVGQPMSEVREALRETSQIEYQKMERGSGWLRILAVVSPLLGLGGTLVGIIDRLRDLSESGIPADTAAICGAIAPTIVTTVVGLGVGVFALIAYAFLNSTIASSKRILDELNLEFINLLEEPSN